MGPSYAPTTTVSSDADGRRDPPFSTRVLKPGRRILFRQNICVLGARLTHCASRRHRVAATLMPICSRSFNQILLYGARLSF